MKIEFRMTPTAPVSDPSVDTLVQRLHNLEVAVATKEDQEGGAENVCFTQIIPCVNHVQFEMKVAD